MDREGWWGVQKSQLLQSFELPHHPSPSTHICYNSELWTTLCQLKRNTIAIKTHLDIVFDYSCILKIRMFLSSCFIIWQMITPCHVLYNQLLLWHFLQTFSGFWQCIKSLKPLLTVSKQICAHLCAQLRCVIAFRQYDEMVHHWHKRVALSEKLS